MAKGYFQVPLTVKPAGGGAAQLHTPAPLANHGFAFVVVKDGGEEAIVEVNAPTEALKKLERSRALTKLTKQGMETLRQSYPEARLKRKYRQRESVPLADDDEQGAQAAAEPSELDKKGNPIVDTLQTVRAGFYLIDVPVIPPR